VPPVTVTGENRACRRGGCWHGDSWRFQPWEAAVKIPEGGISRNRLNLKAEPLSYLSHCRSQVPIILGNYPTLDRIRTMHKCRLWAPFSAASAGRSHMRSSRTASGPAASGRSSARRKTGRSRSAYPACDRSPSPWDCCTCDTAALRTGSHGGRGQGSIWGPCPPYRLIRGTDYLGKRRIIWAGHILVQSPLHLLGPFPMAVGLFPTL
jgi:hypothetical protein